MGKADNEGSGMLQVKASVDMLSFGILNYIMSDRYRWQKYLERSYFFLHRPEHSGGNILTE